MHIFQTTAKEVTLNLSLEYVRIHMRIPDVEAKNDAHKFKVNFIK